MKLTPVTCRIDEIRLQSLAVRCLKSVRELYPTKWEDMLKTNYGPKIVAYADDRKLSPDCAAVELYNREQFLTEKVLFMAGLAYLLEW